MPRYPLHAASGTGISLDWERKTIRLARYGCANRPFYHIVVMNSNLNQRDPPIEQLGTFDPMTNQYNERLVSLNLERIQYWLGQGNVTLSKSLEEILGLSGFLPINPYTYIKSWRARKRAEEEEKKAALQQADQDSQKAEQSN